MTKTSNHKQKTSFLSTNEAKIQKPPFWVRLAIIYQQRPVRTFPLSPHRNIGKLEIGNRHGWWHIVCDNSVLNTTQSPPRLLMSWTCCSWRNSQIPSANCVNSRCTYFALREARDKTPTQVATHNSSWANLWNATSLTQSWQPLTQWSTLHYDLWQRVSMQKLMILSAGQVMSPKRGWFHHQHVATKARISIIMQRWHFQLSSWF